MNDFQGGLHLVGLPGLTKADGGQLVDPCGNLQHLQQSALGNGDDIIC